MKIKQQLQHKKLKYQMPKFKNEINRKKKKKNTNRKREKCNQFCVTSLLYLLCYLISLSILMSYYLLLESSQVLVFVTNDNKK